MIGPGWCIRAFSRQTEELEGNIELRGATDDDIRRLLGIESNVSMPDSYPLDVSQAELVRPFTNEPLDFDRYLYFVEHKNE